MSLEMQVIMADYQNESGAKDTLKTIKKQKLKSGAVAILSKSEKGKIHVKETDDWGGGKGAVAGAIAAGFIPIVGWLGGAIIGGVAAKMRDGGFPNDKLKAMAEGLEPGHSMFVMLTDSDSVAAVESVLTDSGGEIISHQVSADLTAQLEEAVETGEVPSEATDVEEEDEEAEAAAGDETEEGEAAEEEAEEETEE
ncbi:MAG: DUF1269 domain-containing protein [Candidatus Promineifilaceae bacterium]|nr:DUF1269 domain-containing protein [Candidatus Promineifilaceae bacterium]